MSLPATIPNPFRSVIVSDPWQSPESDVTAVHRAAFERCRAALAAVRSNQRTTSVLVHGDAGSGKTHLLARLHAHIVKEAEADGPGGLQEAIFVSVRLQTGARMIWRHLRDRFASDLLRQAGGGSSQLERLLLHHLTGNGLIEGDGAAWLKLKKEETAGTNAPCHELEKVFDRIDAAGRLSHNLRAALGHLLLGRHRGLAGAWLRGESLPEAAIRRLEIIGGRDDDEDLEEQARRVTLALSSLATPELPIIFCFDQIEALQAHPQDSAGLFAFGQMISALHDETGNALLISCSQTAFRDTLSRFVRRADQDRLGEFAIVPLEPLTWEEAAQVIRARMDALPGLAELRATRHDPLWPLRADEIKTRFEYNRCLARTLIAHCAELFEAQRADGVGHARAPALATTAQFLDRALEERREKALETSAPSQTDQIITHGLPSLAHLAHKDWRQEQQGLPEGVDLLFEGPGGKVAISVCNSKHWPSLVRKLERLNAHTEQKRLDQLILLRDSRLPISPTAIKTRTLRDQLLQKGARWIEPSVEALAVLDALRQLLSDAKAGELDNHGKTVSLQSVQDWLVSNLAPELEDLLNEILPSAQPSADGLALYKRLARLLLHYHVVSIVHAADLLEREVDEITGCAQLHPDSIGLLGEPPAVLFQVVSEAAPV